MKYKSCFSLLIVSIILLCASIPLVSAKAPITAKIVFTSARDDNREIYIMNPDGNGQVRLTHNRADDAMPSWSPTGEQILFPFDRDRFLLSRDLYLMNPGGKNARRVFSKSKDRSGAAWSPDGTEIAFTSSYGTGLVQINILNVRIKKTASYFSARRTNIMDNRRFSLVSNSE